MSADQNLLFGMLALQMDFVSREQLLEAMHAWMLRKQTSLGELLRENGALSPEDQQLVEGLVARQVRRHGDAAKGLASLRVDPEARRQLEQLPDADVQATLATITEAPCPIPAPNGDHPPADRRYRALSFHARGGLGEVYLAHDGELRREVALKRLRPEHADDAGCRARFVREAEITGHLAHPGIVAIHGLVRDEGGPPEYAMPFLRGDTLHEAVQRFHRLDRPGRDPGERSLALRELLTRFVAVCNAVGYAHTRGVVHRDLKPGNVMLGEFGETLVVDWGLAKVVQAGDGETTPHRPPVLTDDDATATRLGQVLGTPAFLPPEQARGEQDKVGPLTDVWALGALLYATLTGKAPYSGEQALERAKGCRFTPPREASPSVPRALEAVCLKAMATEPEGRYRNARQLADEVTRWLADEPVEAYREPPAARLQRWARRRRTLVSSGVAALLMAVVGLSLGLVAVNAERVRTRDQRDRAERAEGEASGNLEQAEANLKLAKQAIDECYNVATEDPIFQRPRMEKARKLLLARTLPFYKNFRSQRPDDHRLQWEEAEQWLRVAGIERALNHLEEGRAAYQKAKSFFGRLAATYPDEPKYRHLLGWTHNNLGLLLGDLGRLGEAMEEYERARRIFAELSAAQPNLPRPRRDVAATHHNMGTALSKQGKHQEALREFERARGVVAALAASHPNIPDYQHLLLGNHNNMGLALSALGKSGEALREYECARGVAAALAASHPNVPDYQHDLAVAHDSLGGLLAALGRLEEAEKEYEQARRIGLKLAASHPDLPQYQQSLARAHGSLGKLLQQQGRREEALKVFEQVRRILARLSSSHPDVPGYQHDLASAHGLLGEVLDKQGKRQEALNELEQARRIFAVLADSHHDVPKYQHDLAVTHNKLGLLLNSLKRREEALKEYERARRILAVLVASHPDVPDYRHSLGGTLVNLSNLQHALGNPDEALQTVEQAIPVLRSALQQQPQDPTYRLFLRNAHSSRSRTLGQLNRYREAAAGWSEVLRLESDQAEVPNRRCERAIALALAGDHLLAAAEANELSRAASLRDFTLYNLACVYALSAASRPLPIRDKDADGYARAAVALLQRAAKAGFFRDTANVTHLHKDDDFACLRDRDDYRAFVASLPAAKPKP